MTNNIKYILFLGDVTGRLGRFSVRDFLFKLGKNKCENVKTTGKIVCNRPELLKKIDLVIANCENASGGFGLTKKNYEDLLAYGVDIMTSGNHIWDKAEIFEYINEAHALIRPLNYSSEFLPGAGSKVFDFGDDFKIGIISILGSTFMPPINTFWQIIRPEIDKLKKITPNILIDFHAEATAEKICFARFVSNLGVCAVLGTHTHVQTADEQIINEKTAYITDAGFCGATDGVIGTDFESSFAKLAVGLSKRSHMLTNGKAQAQGCIIKLDANCAEALEIERVKFFIDYREENVMKENIENEMR